MNIENNLKKIQSKYESVIGDSEQRLSGKIDFEFNIQHQPSDGWTIVCQNAHVAPLGGCLKIIKEKGILSYEDFKRTCI